MKLAWYLLAARAFVTPKWLFRYVDDSYVCVKREHVDEFNSHLNSINLHIKFTIEIESEGSTGFLDTKKTKQEDGTTTVPVYRKATNTDLVFKSQHHPQYKHSVVRTLMDRAKNILPLRTKCLGKLSE